MYHRQFAIFAPWQKQGHTLGPIISRYQTRSWIGYMTESRTGVRIHPNLYTG